MPSIHVFSRAQPGEEDSASLSNPIYLAGLIVALVILAFAGGWMGMRYYRKRQAAKRESQMGAAFLNVKGLVREGGSLDEKSGSLQRSATRGGGFSRENIDSTIVLPEKARVPVTTPREEIIAQYRQSGVFPKPFNFALAASGSASASSASPRSSMLEPPRKSHSRSSSFMSFMSSSQNRFSVMSTTSSFDPTTTTGTLRKVRQTADPVLPDELLVRLGEHLTVVQSFDDGWCLVGRENASLITNAKSLFKPVADSNIELGVVPAWCFLKPVKGLRAERPMRTSSLGITVNLDAPASSRHELASWSNF